MPAPNETHIQNEFVKMALAGLIKREDRAPEIVKLRPDRSLSVWMQMVGLGDGRQRIVALDDNGLLRVRPYEPIHPVGGIGQMPGGPTEFYKSENALSRVYVELVNRSGASATFTVSKTNSAVTAQIALAAVAPLGVGVRLGPYDLEVDGTIDGFSNPANSVDIHVIVDRFGPAGDEP